MNKKIFFAVFFSAVVLGIVAYKILYEQQKNPSGTMPIFQKRQATPTPAPVGGAIPLEISQPISGSIVRTQVITLQGKTTPNASVFINEQELNANAQGSFSAQVTLDEGENIIFILVSDEDGNHTDKEILVIYEPE